MKYLLPLLFVALFGCTKEPSRACYTCIHNYIVDDTVGGRRMADTVRYCDKTESEARGIEDSTPRGVAGDRHYARMACKKD